MIRFGQVVRWLVVGVVLAVVSAACSGGDDVPETTKTTRPPVTVTCNGADEVNQDDDGAAAALLLGSQLPPGTWGTAKTPPCPWALSADELLATPECRTASEAAGAPANAEQRNGNARKTFSRTDGIQLDDRIEIYTSSQNVHSIRAILTSPSMAACYEAAVQQRAGDEPGATVSDVRVTSSAVQPDPTALGLGFPAVAGYPADPGFAHSVDITFTLETGTSSRPVAMRVVTFGSGGLMSTVTLIGSTQAELDRFGLDTTVQNAATSFRAITNSD